MYERKHVREIQGYVPGHQPDGVAIKLNTNENPFPPSARVMACLADVLSVSLQRYPDASATAFRQVAARIHGLAPDEIVATNGGDELLRLALTTFADPRHPVGIVTPGYGLYSVLAGLHQAPLSEVPLTETWQLPVTTASRWNAARVPDEPARPIGNALSDCHHPKARGIVPGRARDRRSLCGFRRSGTGL